MLSAADYITQSAEINTTTSSSIVTQLNIIAKFGILITTVTDNGPQFNL